MGVIGGARVDVVTNPVVEIGSVREVLLRMLVLLLELLVRDL